MPGSQGERRRLEVVGEQVRVVERRGAGARGVADPGARARRAPRPGGRCRGGRPRRRRRRSRARPRRGSARPRTPRAAAAPPPPRRRPRGAPGSDGSARGRRRPVGRRARSSPATSSTGEAQHRGRVGAAAAEPGGDRDPLLDLDPHRRPLPAALAELGEGAAPPGSAPRRPGSTTSSALGVGHRDPVGERQRHDQRAQVVLAVGARPAEVEAEVQLGRGAQGHRALQRSPPARRSPRARAPRRGSPRPGRRRRAPRGRGRGRARARRARASPRSALRRWAKPPRTSRRTVVAGRRAPPPHPDDRRVDARARVEDGPVDPAHELDLAGELGHHARRAVGLAPGPRRQPLGDLQLHHHRPALRPPAASRSCAAGAAWPPSRAGWRRSRPEPASSAARSRRIASPQCSSTLPSSVGERARARRRRRSSSSTTCRRETAGASRSVSAPPPPPTSSTTSSAPTPESRTIASSRLGSREEVLAEPPLAGAGPRRAHHPKTRAAFASTVRSSSA